MFNKSVLKNRHFRNLWLGQTISQFGDAFYYQIFLFMVYRITHSAGMVGFMGMVEVAPFFVFGPLAGMIADRIDRRKIMLRCDIASIIVLLIFGAYTFSAKQPAIEIVFIAASCLSIINAFFMPAKSAALPQIVKGNQLSEANAFMQSTHFITPALGIALSIGILGLVERLFPDSFFFLGIMINALTFGLSALFIRLLHSLLPLKEAEENENEKPMEGIMCGLNFIRKNSVLKIILAVNCLYFLMVSLWNVVFLASNDEWFGGKYMTFAVLELAAFLGVILGCVASARLKISRPGLNYVIGISAIGISVALIPVFKSFTLYFLLNFISGAIYQVAEIPLTTYIQLTVPNNFLGRVNSTMSMLTWGIMPLGMALAGTLMECLGVSNVLYFMGFGMILSGIIGLINRPFCMAKMPEPRREEEELLLTHL